MAQSAFIEKSNYVIVYEPSILGYIRDDLKERKSNAKRILKVEKLFFKKKKKQVYDRFEIHKELVRVSNCLKQSEVF